jgi:dienelactone hydrolase
MHNTSRPGTLFSAVSAVALFLGAAGCVAQEPIASESEDVVSESEQEIIFISGTISYGVTFPGPANTELDGDLLSGVIYTKVAINPSPRPAVILMHGCSGMWKTSSIGMPNPRKDEIEKWGMKLASNGIDVLAVDSFTRRNSYQDHCGESGEDPSKYTDPYTIRAQDVNAARAFLASQTGIDSTRIGLIGWSHGAAAAMVDTAATPKDDNVPKSSPPPFAATVLFYPGCGLNLGFHTGSLKSSFWRPRTKLFLNIGNYDQTVSYQDCQTRADIAINTYGAGPGATNEVSFILFPNANHAFDGNSRTWPSSACYMNYPAGSQADQCAADTADIKSLDFLLDELL